MSEAIQFVSAGQRKETAIRGMWLFLATEVIFFAHMFAVYAVYRWSDPTGFRLGSAHEELWLGTINTAVLLLSSFTIALAAALLERGRRGVVLMLLAATVVLGGVFLAIKGVEYHAKYTDGLVPGPTFRSDLAPAQLFFMLYFVMTGVHALHLFIGCGVVSVMALQIVRGRVSAEHATPLEVTALYWHFVDAIWVVLFPLFYLVR
jgi:cytochrome c oxidase subunit 3